MSKTESMATASTAGPTADSIAASGKMANSTALETMSRLKKIQLGIVQAAIKSSTACG